MKAAGYPYIIRGIEWHRFTAAGKLAIVVKHLDGGPSYFFNADQPMQAAGLIQLPIMLEVDQQAAEEKIKLTDRLSLQEADKVLGNGILGEHFSAGASFFLRDAVRLMIVYSDQTATNLVLDQIAIAATNQRMQSRGLRNRRSMPRHPARAPLPSTPKQGSASVSARRPRERW